MLVTPLSWGELDTIDLNFTYFYSNNYLLLKWESEPVPVPVDAIALPLMPVEADPYEFYDD